MTNKYTPFFILPILFGVNTANSSECIGSGCEIEQVQEVPQVQYSILEKELSLCTVYDTCPFDSEKECEVWYKKPIYKTTTMAPAPHISAIKLDDMLYDITVLKTFSTTTASAKPLVKRYKLLTKAAKTCCTDGIIYEMRKKGFSDKKIYNYLKDDVNYFDNSSRCLFISDNDVLDTRTTDMVTNVRNTCLCKNRKWFDSLLQPFKDIYYLAPQFQFEDFEYTFIDGLNRTTTVSINRDVQTVLETLDMCPD